MKPSRLPVAFKPHICRHEGRWRVYSTLFSDDTQVKKANEFAAELNNPREYWLRKEFETMYAVPKDIFYSNIQEMYVRSGEWRMNQRVRATDFDQCYRKWLKEQA